MLSRSEFIRLSLETHLFFARIMKEHAFFLQVSFTPKDINFAQEADFLRMEFDKLLWEVVCLSDNVVSSNVLKSDEIVTEYTIRTENLSSYYTGVTIPTYITQAEMELTAGKDMDFDPGFEKEVCMLNERAISLIKAIIEFKKNLLEDVLACHIFTSSYPALIEHVLEEAELYLETIMKLQNKEKIDKEKEIYERELFWNKAMAGHSEFIRGLLDPSEKELMKMADDFAEEFDEIAKELEEAIEKCLPIDKIIEESLEETKKIVDFNAQATKGLLECKIRSIIIPLLGDHVLRESNHLMRLLKDTPDTPKK